MLQSRGLPQEAKGTSVPLQAVQAAPQRRRRSDAYVCAFLSPSDALLGLSHDDPVALDVNDFDFTVALNELAVGYGVYSRPIN